jgi:hypothetical protein
MKKYYLLATALAALVSCSENEFVGDNNLGEANGQVPISFTSGVGAITRGEKTGAAAATDLNNQFFVYGIKNESSDGAGNVGTANTVFKNYVVKWAGQALSTTSNTEGWEYVGYTFTAKEQANVTANSGTPAQTIKYWDFGAADYTFYAFTAATADIEGDKITVTKVQDKKTTDNPAHTVYDNGYTVTLAADADLDKLYFAERVNITDKANTDRTADNKYAGNVTFRFHNAATKVRVAMYETVPGYSVTIDKFKVDDDGTDPAFSAMTDEKTANFAANFQNSGKGAEGSMTVTYISSGSTQNHPSVAFTPTAGTNKVLALGTGLKENIILGTTINDATFDKAEKAFTSVFPKEDNTQNLKLKLDYTLTAPVTGEQIKIANATAEVPANYLKWKPGFAYTYIFKITDDKLYPITFDAVEITAEDGNVEYITTVSEPSITTYANKSNVTVDNEYLTGSNIYVAVMEGSTNQTLTVGTNAKLYKATLEDTDTSDGITTAIQDITEASVANTLKAAETPAGTWAVTDANKFRMTVTAVDGMTAVTEIAAGDTPDNNAISVKGAKFAPAEPTFTAQTPVGSENPSTEGWYERSGEAGSYIYTITSDTSVDSGKTYYKKTATTAGYYVFEYTYDTDKKAYKVIKVVDKY